MDQAPCTGTIQNNIMKVTFSMESQSARASAFREKRIKLDKWLKNTLKEVGQKINLLKEISQQKIKKKIKL